MQRAGAFDLEFTDSFRSEAVTAYGPNVMADIKLLGGDCRKRPPAGLDHGVILPW